MASSTWPHHPRFLRKSTPAATFPRRPRPTAERRDVTVLVMRRSILTEKVARRRYHVMREYSVNPLTRVRLEDAMERDVPVLPADTSIATIGEWLAARDPRLGHRYAWPLVDRQGGLVGLVTRADLMKALDRVGGADCTALDAGASSLVVTYPDELLEEGMAKLEKALIAAAV